MDGDTEVLAEGEEMRSDIQIKEIAKVGSGGFELYCYSNLSFCISGHFQYETGCQEFGWSVNLEFVRRLCNVFKVSSLSETKGRYCFVTHNDITISKIEPIFTDEGTPFDIFMWSKNHLNEMGVGGQKDAKITKIPTESAADAARVALRKVPWIPCKEKLPQKDGFYEVTGSGAYVLDYAFFHQSSNPPWLKSIMHPSNIIAWRPIMSEPYEEQEC